MDETFISQATTELLGYGVLGIVAIVEGYVIFHLYRRMVLLQDRLLSRDEKKEDKRAKKLAEDLELASNLVKAGELMSYVVRNCPAVDKDGDSDEQKDRE